MSIKKRHLIVHCDKISCPPHINSELEIIFVEKGSVAVRHEGSTEILNAGDAMLIFPFRLHCFEADEDSRAYVLMFPLSIAESFYETYAQIVQDESLFHVSNELADFIKYSLERYRQVGDLFTAKSLFYALVSVFVSRLETLANTSRSGKDTTRKTLEYIYSHLNEPLTLSDTANKLGVSKSSLTQMFEKYIGIGFKPFLSTMRIEKSCVLLESTDFTVTEIAYECGFGSLRSFNRHFSVALGCSPTEYRKKFKMSD